MIWTWSIITSFQVRWFDANSHQHHEAIRSRSRPAQRKRNGLHNTTQRHNLKSVSPVIFTKLEGLSMFRIQQVIIAASTVAVSSLMFSPAHAGSSKGTIFHADGSKTFISQSRSRTNRSYVVQIDKNGRQIGGCVREPRSALQMRRAFMRAKSKWRAGYIPRKMVCQYFN